MNADKTVKVSAEFTALATRALSLVAANCDGAKDRDGAGFNRDDLQLGVNDLVAYLAGNQPTSLRAGTVNWVLFMLVFYQRQWIKTLPDGTLARVKAMQAHMRKR